MYLNVGFVNEYFNHDTDMFVETVRRQDLIYPEQFGNSYQKFRAHTANVIIQLT